MMFPGVITAAPAASFRPDKSYLVSLPTTQAYELPVSSLLSDMLEKIDNERQVRIAIAIQEAVSNAVIHGNLEVESFSPTPDDFERYYKQINERLADAHYGSRKVHISLRISQDAIMVRVDDEGKGYCYSDISRYLASRYFRGLRIIHTYCRKVDFENAGRSIIMEFPNVAPALS